MSRYTLLSHGIDGRTPLYPGTPAVRIKPVRSMARGDTCNTRVVTLPNHCGTHLDAPRHFVADGRAVGDYPFDELVFARPVILDCPKAADEAIGVEDLTRLDCAAAPDALILRTGFSRFRGGDAERYCSKNPFLSPEAAAWIRREMPTVRAVGIDCISVSSAGHREEGRRTHLALLGAEGGKGRPVIIIEDMRLPEGLTKLCEMVVVPFLTGAPDGSPCAVIGVTDD